MRIKTIKGFTILELLVVIAILGIFTVVAYPNISKWIDDRAVKKDVYDVINYINERKNEIQSGEYGMHQVVLNRVCTMILVQSKTWHFILFLD